MIPHQSEFGMFIPETADMPEPLTDLDDLETVTYAILLTFVALGYKVSMEDVNIYEFYITFSIASLDETDLEKEVGKMYVALAVSLNTREFTLKAPLSEEEPRMMLLTLQRPEAEAEEAGMSILEWLISLYRDGRF
jgi:hypothetical protein